MSHDQSPVMARPAERRRYAVPALSCEHCREAISEQVGHVAGVASVEVDLSATTVTVTGASLSDTAIRAAIDDAGYVVA